MLEVFFFFFEREDVEMVGEGYLKLWNPRILASKETNKTLEL